MKRISLILFVLVLCFAGSIALGSADPNPCSSLGI